MGLPVTPDVDNATGFEQLMQVIGRMMEGVVSLPFEVDGIVIKLNHFADRDELGTTSKSPRVGPRLQMGTLRSRNESSQHFYSGRKDGNIDARCGT